MDSRYDWKRVDRIEAGFSLSNRPNPTENTPGRSPAMINIQTYFQNFELRK